MLRNKAEKSWFASLIKNSIFLQTLAHYTKDKVLWTELMKPTVLLHYLPVLQI